MCGSTKQDGKLTHTLRTNQTLMDVPRTHTGERTDSSIRDVRNLDIPQPEELKLDPYCFKNQLKMGVHVRPTVLNYKKKTQRGELHAIGLGENFLGKTSKV